VKGTSLPPSTANGRKGAEELRRAGALVQEKQGKATPTGKWDGENGRGNGEANEEEKSWVGRTINDARASVVEGGKTTV